MQKIFLMSILCMLTSTSHLFQASEASSHVLNRTITLQVTELKENILKVSISNGSAPYTIYIDNKPVGIEQEPYFLFDGTQYQGRHFITIEDAVGAHATAKVFGLL